MSDTTIATRYAKSLTSLAASERLTDEVYNDVTDIKHALNLSREFENLMISPVVKAEKKKSILALVLAGKQKATRDFINLLVDKRREMYLSLICDAFISNYLNEKGIVKAKVTSAMPIDADTLASVKNYLASTFGKSDVEIENVVDKGVIGGMVIQYEDKLLDMSVKKELQEIKKQIIYN